MHADNHNRKHSALPVLNIEQVKQHLQSMEKCRLLWKQADPDLAETALQCCISRARVTKIELNATFLPRLPYDGSGTGPPSIRVINKPDNCYCCLETITNRAACTELYERQLFC